MSKRKAEADIIAALRAAAPPIPSWEPPSGETIATAKAYAARLRVLSAELHQLARELESADPTHVRAIDPTMRPRPDAGRIESICRTTDRIEHEVRATWTRDRMARMLVLRTFEDHGSWQRQAGVTVRPEALAASVRGALRDRYDCAEYADRIGADDIVRGVDLMSRRARAKKSDPASHKWPWLASLMLRVGAGDIDAKTLERDWQTWRSRPR